jgi:hypothetical protein
MKAIKKAQNGAKTKDSTAYFQKQSKENFKKASDRYGYSSDEMRKKASEYSDKAIQAQKDELRQSNKGKPGYDANGYPIKKKKGQEGVKIGKYTYTIKNPANDTIKKPKRTIWVNNPMPPSKTKKTGIDALVDRATRGYKNGGSVKAKDGKWMQKAAASIKKRGTAGKCTPITKPGCTGKAKALAKTFKKIAKSNKKK